MLKLAVIVSGGGTNLQALIDKIEQGKLPDVSIELVISNRADAYALERARQHGINTELLLKKNYDSAEAFEAAFLAMLKQYHTDLLVLAGCLMIIPESVVKSYKNRIINIHPSLIPSFCGNGFYGLKVHEEALKRGVKITGATVHFVDEGTDTGPIILQKAVRVEADDTPELLQKRVMEEAEWEILPQAVELIAQNKLIIVDNIVRIKQE